MANERELKEAMKGMNAMAIQIALCFAFFGYTYIAAFLFATTRVCEGHVIAHIITQEILSGAMLLLMRALANEDDTEDDNAPATAA
jgi:hypothetical protein